MTWWQEVRRGRDRSGPRWPARWRRLAAIAAVGTLWLTLSAVPARADDSTAVAGLGVVGPEEGENHAAVLDLEYRFRPWRFGIGPVVGISATSDGGGYVRAGLARDFPFGERWNVNLSTAAGGYQAGHGKDLGRGFEFRSAIDLSCEVQPGVRFGAAIAHLSNAGIGAYNPGIETFSFTIAFTPRRMAVRH